MSSKQGKKQFVMPKLPPDLIVTRYRAQKHMKLKKNDKITKCTALPKKSNGTPLKNKNNKKKVIKKEVSNKELAGDKEYYPNKLKRNMMAKKIVLKPKYNMKVVAGTNKRKRATPKRDISTIEFTSRPSEVETNMCDTVSLTDDTQSLTDEDWMEILTCPSPVWWEDTSSPEDLEDDVSRQSDEKTIEGSDPTSIGRHLRDQTTNDNNVDSVPHPDSSYTDFEQEISQFKIKTDKFTQKKKKLEHVLENIVCKNNRDSKRRVSESTDGEDIFSDLSFSEEDIIQHLENINIPIESSKNEKIGMVDDNSHKIIIDNSSDVQKDADSHLNSNGCVIKSSNDKNSSIKVKKQLNDAIKRKNVDKTSPKRLKSGSVLKKNNTSIKGCKNTLRVAARNSLLRNANISIEADVKNECMSNVDENITNKVNERQGDSKLTGYIKVRNDLIKNELNVAIPNEMPPLQRRPVLNREIKTIDFTADDMDSISDANIKFISDDDSIDEMCTNKNDLEVNIDDIASKNDFPKNTNEATDCITVYRIVANEKKRVDNVKNEITKKNDNVNDKLNDFFKKCKSNKRLRKERADEIKNVDSDANDVDEENRLNGCDYCIAKTEQGSTDFSCDTCDMSPVFSCDLCNFRSNTKDVIINHVTRCDKYNRTVVIC